MIEETGQSLTPEIAAIKGIFISVEKIKAFHNDSLYLLYIRTLINERYNISFPDDSKVFERFFADSITLKNLMGENTILGDNAVSDEYFSLIKNMFAQMKTPYYDSYFRCICAFEKTFSTNAILKGTLSDFYSLMIKSSPEKCDLISMVAEYGPSLKQYPYLDEALISKILIHHLSNFCMENNYWLSAELSHVLATKEGNTGFIHEKQTLRQYLQKEEGFLASLTGPVASLCDYLALKKEYFHEEDTNAASVTDLTLATKQDLNSEFLNTYAYNMNTVSYITDPALCRDQEILDLELILISPKKSPILIGDAGTGKTSIVEGLAYRLAKNEVPDLLKGKKIFKLTTTSLLSGTKYVGEMEERMKKLTDELRKYPEVILFIDEIHTIVGAGSTESSNNDISNMLKPFIDRGDIKIIGATTKLEYNAYLLPDRALSRRFYPIAVEEPDEETTLQILYGTIPSIEYETRVTNPYSKEETLEILKTLIEISRRENQPEGQHTNLPELPLTLLEMGFSYAALSSRSTLSTEDLTLSILHSNLLSRQAKKRLKNSTIFSI